MLHCRLKRREGAILITTRRLQNSATTSADRKDPRPRQRSGPRLHARDHGFSALKVAKDFPVFGTGNGTFRYVEPLHRTSEVDVGIDYEYAHNDYLEALVEGGLVRLMVSLLAIGLPKF